MHKCTNQYQHTLYNKLRRVCTAFDAFTTFCLIGSKTMIFLSKCIGHRMHISVLWETPDWSTVCSDAHLANYAQYVHIKTCRFPLVCADAQI